MKELRELPREAYDETFEALISQYSDQRFGAAADLARFATLYDQGGFYMDMDFQVKKWDNEIMHYFDSIHWKEKFCSFDG